MPTPLEAFFLPVEGAKPGQRFCIFHPAYGQTLRGAVLYVHPFAEEMNKSRRMAALQSRAMAQAGFAVLQIDLLGCGDSSGDFGDVTWQDWVDDVVRAARWLEQRCATSYGDQSKAPLWLWGLRSGCLLAAQAARVLPAAANFIFWAPPASGKLLMQQFLRLKAASDMLAGSAKGVTENLRQQLATGVAVDIAGYVIAPGLATGLEQATLTPSSQENPVPTSNHMLWFEMSSRPDTALSPVGAKATESWRQIGYSVHSAVIDGPAFWQTTEIEDAPALIQATVAGLLTSTEKALS